MKYNSWELKQNIENQYRLSISKLIKELSNSVEASTPEEFLSFLTGYASSPAFFELCQITALRMVTNLHTDNTRTWREAARQSSRGRSVYESIIRELNSPMGAEMMNIISENAAYIQNIPIEEAQRITEAIATSTLSGERAVFNVENLKKQFPDFTKARATLIARTETSKAQTALTQTRAQNLGINWYIWRTSKDARVRESHRKMDGILCNFNDPPEPEILVGMKSEGAYNAGEIYNCRCYAEPLIDTSFIIWPHKIYLNGAVTMISLTRFREEVLRIA